MPRAMEYTHAVWAADPAASRGRMYGYSASPTRSEFQRDRDRIIHSTAFRRLAHKTQVFVPHEGDHYRTRLTHTIEVGQIARALSRSLGLDGDLAEALALAHDLGHTCFGHTGEEVLDERMKAYGGFDHNAQALRVVTKLERRYAEHDGLNLTWECLEGLVKHNGPLLTPDGRPAGKYAVNGLPKVILEFDEEWPLDLSGYSSAEAQAAAIADDIAYNAHDIDDGLRAGLFGVADLKDVDFLRDIVVEIERLHPGLETPRMIHEVVRRVITRLVEDVIASSRNTIAAAGISSPEDVRRAGRALIGFSPAMAQTDRALKQFLYPHMYRHPRVMRVRREASGVVDRLFTHFLRHPQDMSGEWGLFGPQMGDEAGRFYRIIGDYIAGMTDLYAMAEHRRLFGQAPDLRQ
ncbi:MAG: deoxyguanosinetriphosphate triphosphohydrolase [Hyphomicrobiales bacterium]|nr:deoxyguanosinetriphosphate triphosphohydrolase [Hyphomicrobiales bacterium]